MTQLYTVIMGFSPIDLLFPKKCLGCGRFGGYLCKKCRASQPLHFAYICPVCERRSADGRTHSACLTQFTIDGATFVFGYKPPISSLLKKLKYAFSRDLAGLVSWWATEELKKMYLPRRTFTLLPIPLHLLRNNWRGFNQSEILGKDIASSMGWTTRNDILTRSGLRSPQTEVREASKRKKNVRGIFSVSPNAYTLMPNAILLFDDVWTTGSTMREAARVLKQNGAKFVWGLAIAR